MEQFAQIERDAYSVQKVVFVEEAEMQYKRTLGYSKTRWLALLPAVERIFQMYSKLKLKTTPNFLKGLLRAMIKICSCASISN